MKPTVKCEFIRLESPGPDGCQRYRAIVRRTSEHPHLGPDREGSLTFTSLVIRVDFDHGIIETLNTYYVFK